MSGFWRLMLVLGVGIWMLGTLLPQLSCMWEACPDNGLYTDYDGVVVGIGDGSPAAKASIRPGDRVAAPFPRGLFQLPPPPLTFKVVRSATARTVTLSAQPVKMTDSDRAYFISGTAAYLVFLIVGSTILLLRPSATTWAFYLYCVLRRFGDLGFYWPGSDSFFWANYLALAALGGASCALVTIFALRFPSNRLEGWRIPANRAAVALAIVLPLAWLGVFGRIVFLGLPSQWLFDRLVNFTSIVYLAAAAIFIATLVRSHGDERQRMRWILVFPVVLLLRVAAINTPYSLPDWFSGLLTVLGVCVPLTVAYAVIRSRVFNIQFAISRALIYGAITTIIAGTFLLLDWFMGKEFSQTQLTLTAEIIVALALGSSLSMLHHGVDRFVDGTFFRARHEAEKRLARAAVDYRAPTLTRWSTASWCTSRCRRSISPLPRSFIATVPKETSFAKSRPTGAPATSVISLKTIPWCCIFSPRACRCDWPTSAGRPKTCQVSATPCLQPRCCCATSCSRSSYTVLITTARTSTPMRYAASSNWPKAPAQPTTTSKRECCAPKWSC